MDEVDNQQQLLESYSKLIEGNVDVYCYAKKTKCVKSICILFIISISHKL